MPSSFDVGVVAGMEKVAYAGQLAAAAPPPPPPPPPPGGGGNHLHLLQPMQIHRPQLPHVQDPISTKMKMDYMEQTRRAAKKQIKGWFRKKKKTETSE